MCAEEVFIVLQLRWVASGFRVYHCVPLLWLTDGWSFLSACTAAHVGGRATEVIKRELPAPLWLFLLPGWLTDHLCFLCFSPLTFTVHHAATDTDSALLCRMILFTSLKKYINFHQLCFGLPVLLHALREFMTMDGWMV